MPINALSNQDQIYCTATSVALTFMWSAAFATCTILNNIDPTWAGDPFLPQPGNSTMSPAQRKEFLQDFINRGNIAFPVMGAIGLLIGGLTTRWASKTLNATQFCQAIGGGVMCMSGLMLEVGGLIGGGVFAKNHQTVNANVMMYGGLILCGVFMALGIKLLFMGHRNNAPTEMPHIENGYGALTEASSPFLRYQPSDSFLLSNDDVEMHSIAVGTDDKNTTTSRQLLHTVTYFKSRRPTPNDSMSSHDVEMRNVMSQTDFTHDIAMRPNSRA